MCKLAALTSLARLCCSLGFLKYFVVKTSLMSCCVRFDYYCYYVEATCRPATAVPMTTVVDSSSTGESLFRQQRQPMVAETYSIIYCIVRQAWPAVFLLNLSVPRKEINIRELMFPKRFFIHSCWLGPRSSLAANGTTKTRARTGMRILISFSASCPTARSRR